MYVLIYRELNDENNPIIIGPFPTKQEAKDAKNNIISQRGWITDITKEDKGVGTLQVIKLVGVKKFLKRVAY